MAENDKKKFQGLLTSGKLSGTCRSVFEASNARVVRYCGSAGAGHCSERMLVYGLRVGSTVQQETVQGADCAGHVQPGTFNHPRGQINRRRTSLRGTGKSQGSPRAASANQGRQWAGVHLTGAGRLSILQQGQAGLLPARHADGQSAYRIVQRQLPG